MYFTKHIIEVNCSNNNTNGLVVGGGGGARDPGVTLLRSARPLMSCVIDSGWAPGKQAPKQRFPCRRLVRGGALGITACEGVRGRGVSGSKCWTMHKRPQLVPMWSSRTGMAFQKCPELR